MFKKDFPTFAQVQHGVRQIPRDFNGMSRNALSPSLHLSTPSFSLLPRVPLWIWNQNEKDAGRSKFCHLLEVLQIAEMEPAGSSTLEHSPVLNQIWNSWQKTFVYQDIYIQTKIKIPILWYKYRIHEYKYMNTRQEASVDEVKYTNWCHGAGLDWNLQLPSLDW